MAAKSPRDRFWARGILLGSALTLLGMGSAWLYEATDGFSFLSPGQSRLQICSNRFALDVYSRDLNTYSYVPAEQQSTLIPQLGITVYKQPYRPFNPDEPKIRLKYKYLSEDELKRLGPLKPAP